MKYDTLTLLDRIDLIVREELNRQITEIPFEEFLQIFIKNLTVRITGLIQDEVKYRRF